jgi:hypothetical protein
MARKVTAGGGAMPRGITFSSPRSLSGAGCPARQTPRQTPQTESPNAMNRTQFYGSRQSGSSSIWLGVLALWLAGCTASKPSEPMAGGAAAVERTASPSPVAATAPPAVKPPPTSPSPADARWTSLFDGTSLEGWQITEFAGHGEVEVEKGQMMLRMGAMLTGVNLAATNDLPRTNYELALEAAKLEGSDFFCALTFPVGESCCSFLLGGWGGGVVGISSIDGNDASLNETTKYMDFEKGRWYAVRVRVTPAKLEAWIDDKAMVDVALEGKRISVRPGEIELSQPLGLATWQTTGAVRNVRLRRL